MYTPVCDENGITYHNNCEAKCAGAKTKCQNKCPCEGEYGQKHFDGSHKKCQFRKQIYEQNILKLYTKLPYQTNKHDTVE